MGENNEGRFVELAGVKEIFKREGRWLKIPATKGKLIVSSDIHGDGKVLDLLLERFFHCEDNIFGFL